MAMLFRLVKENVLLLSYNALDKCNMIISIFKMHLKKYSSNVCIFFLLNSMIL